MLFSVLFVLFFFSYTRRQLISTKHNNHILECQVLKSFCLHLNGHIQNRGEEGGLNIPKITGYPEHRWGCHLIGQSEGEAEITTSHLSTSNNAECITGCFSGRSICFYRTGLDLKMHFGLGTAFPPD